MNKVNGSAKGSNFEREVCKQLSLWYSENERDDIFWRTAGSGARATTRAKQGKETSGAYGDITCLDEVGKPLLKTCCFELKRGYGRFDALDLIDKKPTCKPSLLVDFWRQASKSAEDAHVPFPVVIFRRDMRQSCLMSNTRLLNVLSGYVGSHRGIKIVTEIERERVFIMSLTAFLDYATPQAFNSLAIID